jgi:cell division protein FtsL/energy-coupling factor transporter ATP-binding protein EcfA2
MTEGPRLDPQHPWPGLAAFDELARAYFHGRDDEIDELARRIEQTPLVVLFGKSGLGKTSLLRAGLLPRLRERRVLPVYVRLTFQPGAPALMDQVRDALGDALAAEHVDAPAPAADEPLWRYLHRSGLEFWSADNHLLTPLLVFDQFEEVFTLGAADTAAVARFAVELGDLAENRIPQGVQTTEGLHTRAMSYKLLLSLREDFLPELESWRAAIPGLGRARMRLRALGRSQALEAVLGSGGHLMGTSLARRIVDFVAAAQTEGQEMAAPTQAAAASAELDAAFGPTSEIRLARRLEIEPALLSLFCRGLNEQRLRAGKDRFDDALLDDAKQGILADYYRSCFDGMPDSVARWVANELITEKGYRNSVARDDATPAHLTDSELRTLIDRRLLRLEERYGTQRVELTHDLLTRAVREARDRLREDDARTAAEQRAAVERVVLEERLAEERAAERQAAREQALQAEAAAGRRFKRLAIGLAVALVCAAGAVVWAIRQTRAAVQAAALEKHFKEIAIEQSRLAQKQRQLAEQRLQSIADGIGMKQAVLAGDRERIRAYLERARDRRNAEASAGTANGAAARRPSFGARAQPAGYRNPQGQAIHFYSLMPIGDWREVAMSDVAVITYRMDHPTFQNALLATGRESGFTARYTGWGCLTNVVVLIEYVDPARPVGITEFDMCAALP